MDSCKSDTILYLFTLMISPAWVSTLLVVLFPSHIPLHLNMSPLKPSTAVRDFATTLDEAMLIFDDHKLKLKSHTLYQALRVADRIFSWSDYPSWLRDIYMMKNILKDVLEGQREAKILQRDMEDIILADEAETLRLEVQITQHPADSGAELATVPSASALLYQNSPA
ncbi:hypothetical protein EDD18DRAFT_1116079 [Armillaria luteobubalina]|uniref:Uncharacterized protein n=1 Tax=Armillaria luteobubalina TaxID=153913 RepID=A0AA39P0L5_9AGAR|nr:hypothetical protein EDD18DRAFT_1116079 [Armillaria luteobubalina]